MVVLGSKDVWFVGMGSTSSAGKPQRDMWHWNGSTWTNHPIATSAGITGLTGISGSNLQAVGIIWQGNGITGPLSAYKWTGSRWITMGIPATSGRFLPEITMDAANDVWIESATRDNSSVFALHWNGRSWSRIQAPAGLATNPYPAADGHGGAWFGPLAYWTGHTWIDASYLPPTPGAFRSYSAVPAFMAKVPGMANSYWGVGTGSIGNGPQRPAVLYYGPKP